MPAAKENDGRKERDLHMAHSLYIHQKLHMAIAMPYNSHHTKEAVKPQIIIIIIIIIIIKVHNKI